MSRKHREAFSELDAILSESLEADATSKSPKAKVLKKSQRPISNLPVDSPVKKSAAELSVRKETSSELKQVRIKSPPLSSDDDRVVTDPFEEVVYHQGTIEQLRGEVAGLKAKVRDCNRRMRIDLADYKAQIKEAKREMQADMEVFKVQLRSQGEMLTRIEITPLVTRYTINGVTGELRQEPSFKRP